VANKNIDVQEHGTGELKGPHQLQPAEDGDDAGPQKGFTLLTSKAQKECGKDSRKQLAMQARGGAEPSDAWPYRSAPDHPG